MLLFFEEGLRKSVQRYFAVFSLPGVGSILSPVLR